LHNHEAMTHPDLLVGPATADDAGVFRLSDERALVQTVDFFTPVVDDAHDWGRIAAANALSDVYAMGGEPMTALQVVAWPRNILSFELLGEVLRGGADVMAEAGCVIVGGHSIDDPEPKYGFAVTGIVDPARMTSNAAARPGDVLVLTKPIGTGIISTAIKREVCPEPVRVAAVESMARLNRDAAHAMLRAGASAATDVTGFGLLGHLAEVLAASRVGAGIDADAVPVLEGAWALLDEGSYPGGSERNLAAVENLVDGDADVRTLRMLADAQTSGGLLIAVPRGGVTEILESVDGATVIGGITRKAPGRIRIA
jgi:selenide, water dikinase